MDEEVETEHQSDHTALALLGLVLVGIVFVLLSSRVLINSVTVLATEHWHVPTIVIAATLVAFGTSLPELAIGMMSVIKGHNELLVGNIVGADILNVLFVIGASAAAAPLPVLEQSAQFPDIALRLHLPAMLLILALFRIFALRACSRGYFRRWYGAPLVALYLAYTAGQYIVA